MMTDDIDRLEQRIDELTARLRRVEEKVFPGGEEPPVAPLTSERAEEREPLTTSTPRERIHATVILSLLGRSLIVLGGAFLLRWLTQSNVLPQKLGSVLGMIYALLWIAVADFDAGRGRRHSAVFHGITGAFIALPLLVEVTTKFHYLTPMLSAIHLLAFIILGLVVAGRRKLRTLAWIVTLPAAPLAFLLAVRTQAATPFLICLLILGFATLWLGYLRHWHALATVMAGAVNLGLTLTVLQYVAQSRQPSVEPEATLTEVLFLLFGLIALYLGSYCFRVFRRKRTITPLEIGNTLVVFLVGLGGAAIVINASRHSMLPLGVFCLVLSAASYTSAYGLLPRRDPNRRNFLFFTLLALGMGVLGLEMTLQLPAVMVALTAAALIAGALAKPVSSPILFLHGAVYLIAAILRSGLIGATRVGLFGQSAPLVTWFDVPLLLVLVLTMLYPWFPRPKGRAGDMFFGRRAADLFLFLTVLALSSLFVSAIAELSPQGEGTQYRGLLACARTGALALSAAILAWYSHRTRFGNLSWLVYTVLVVGGVKLVAENIAVGGTAVLFISLGLYGGALVLAPRLLHSAQKRATPES
jgi:hypothetical protein